VGGEAAGDWTRGLVGAADFFTLSEPYRKTGRQAAHFFKVQIN
jgi:hypothetical protein